MSARITKRPFAYNAHLVRRLKHLWPLLLLASCAPRGSYDPQGMADSVALIQSGAQMMTAPGYGAYQAPRQSSCHWFGGQWTCTQW